MMDWARQLVRTEVRLHFAAKSLQMPFPPAAHATPPPMLILFDHGTPRSVARWLDRGSHRCGGDCEGMAQIGERRFADGG